MIHYLNRLNLARKRKDLSFYWCLFLSINNKSFTCELILSSESIVDDVGCVLNGWPILMILCRSSVASFKLFIISRQTVSNVDQVNRYPFI